MKKVKNYEIYNLVKQIVRIIRKYIPDKNYKIYLYGSWMKGNALPNSDIDIAIYGQTEVDALIMIKIKDEIENLPTLRSIDLIDLNLVSENFKVSILQKGEKVDG